jgi:hypothetical protein
MSRPKSRQVGTAGLVLRFRDGTCSRGCRRCGEWASTRTWRAGFREARAHATFHDTVDARYVGAPWGIPEHEMPPTSRPRPLRRLAAAMVILALAVLAFGLTVANVSGHAASVPATPSIVVTPTTVAGGGR